MAILVEIAILVEMAMHGQTWPYMAIHGHAWPCMAMHGHAWPDMGMYGHIWPCMAMYGHAWPDMAIISSERHSKSKKLYKINEIRKAKLPLGAQNCERIRKPKFHVFWLFTPLFGRFRLSRVFQTTGFEEIYRLI